MLKSCSQFSTISDGACEKSSQADNVFDAQVNILILW